MKTKPPRVWVKKEKKMYYDLWRLVWGDDGELCEVWANDRTCYQPDEVILLKPIGKQDKKGIQIYEKDICENEYGWRGIITWDSAVPIGERFAWTGWWWHCVDKKRDGKFPFHVDKKTEILGNIYENPDLLGKLESEPGGKE